MSKWRRLWINNFPDLQPLWGRTANRGVNPVIHFSIWKAAHSLPDPGPTKKKKKVKRRKSKQILGLWRTATGEEKEGLQPSKESSRLIRSPWLCHAFILQKRFGALFFPPGSAGLCEHSLLFFCIAQCSGETKASCSDLRPNCFSPPERSPWPFPASSAKGTVKFPPVLGPRNASAATQLPPIWEFCFHTLFSVTLLLYQTLTNQLEISSVRFKLKKKEERNWVTYSSCSKKRRAVKKYVIFLILKAKQCFALLWTLTAQLSNPSVRLRGGQGFAILPPVKFACVGTEHELLADSSAPGWSTPHGQQSILLF